MAPPTTASSAAWVSVVVSSGQPSTATEQAATASPTRATGPGRLPETNPIVTGTAAEAVPSRTAATPTGRPREKQRYAQAAPQKPSDPATAPSPTSPGTPAVSHAA